jgi:all-trans-retinol dehydrogenase (NAD+)
MFGLGIQPLKVNRVLITGGAQGIGRELALGFAAEGAEVIISDINEDKLEQTRKEVEARGVTCRAYQADVTNPDSVLKMRDQLHKDTGPINVLVNNAGVVFGGPFLEVPLEQHFKTYRVNVEGVVTVTHAFLADLIGQSRSQLINLASASGYIALPYGSTYASSKWAAIGFSESIRLELRELGHTHVGVTTVCPSYVGTGMFEGAQPARTTKMVDPRELAAKIIKAAKKNNTFVNEPWLVNLSPIVKGALPVQLGDLISDIFGATSSMSDWKGHS